MSFSSDAKAELCQNRLDKKHIALAEAYGVLLYCNAFSAMEVRVITASPDLVRRLPRLFKRAFALEFDTLPPPERTGKCSFVIRDRDKLARIFAAFGLERDATLTQHINLGALEEEGCMEAFVRGAFLAGGSVTDPEKRYHLELATPHKSVSREMIPVLLDMDLSPKETVRAGNSLLYFKKADLIADFFTRLGAPVTAMSVMTAKVDKEMRNTVTRQINCDSANADKTVAAAQEQLEAIRRVVRACGLDALPEPLKDAALLRITNPAASLADLALLSSPPVTKSCLSHRMKKITALAERLESLE
ncbi:MAG: DNA-binding protein WhiA [Oscillospiraceae bacterium]|nr:DNA-binding protein WhiA [Oscillospiraceae bacterium]